VSLFQALGAALAVYVLYAVYSGTVHAKDRWKSKAIYKEDSPREFWTVIAIYAGLSLALCFVF